MRALLKKRTVVQQFPWEEVFASMGDGLVVLDVERRLVGINPAAERLMGFSAEAVLGYLIDEVFATNKGFLETLRPAFEQLQTWTVRDLSWQNPHGEAISADLSLSPLMDGRGDASGWVLIFRDISPVKKLEEEVRKNDRLAMMGTIAAGLAHEIKNPLGGIKGAAQLIARGAQEPQVQEYLGIIVRESERVDRLISDLLMFARPKPIPLQGCNINEILDNMITLQRESLGKNQIALVRDFDPSLPRVLGDSEQLTQVFLNFFKNAIEALADRSSSQCGRRLIIRTHLNTDFRIRGQDEKKGFRMVSVEIEDNGPGMSAETLEKIFTPFFTTKERGTGLGLAIAQRIVQEHHGLVRVESQTGAGTSVKIFLRSFS